MSLFGKISESFNAIVKNSYQSDDNFNQEEYDKYKAVLSKYKDIKMIRWAGENK